MTRITIWETPDNREQYRDVPCEYRFETQSGVLLAICNRTLSEHDLSAKRMHPWRIYRDAEQPAREQCPTRTLEPDVYRHAVENVIRLVRDHKEFCGINRAEACDVSVYEVRMLLEHLGVELTEEQKRVFV